jgi:plastocyanin
MRRLATLSLFAIFMAVIVIALPASAEDHVVNITYVEDAQGIIHVDMDTPVLQAGDTVTFNCTTGQPFSIQLKGNTSPFADGRQHFDNKNQKSAVNIGPRGRYAYTLYIGKVVIDPVIIVDGP